MRCVYGSAGGGRGLRLLRMLGVGVKASEAADDAHAELSRLIGELRQLPGQLGELRRGARHGQFGGVEVMVMHQLPAALQTLSSERDSKQKALYWRAKVRNWMEKQSQGPDEKILVGPVGPELQRPSQKRKRKIAKKLS